MRVCAAKPGEGAFAVGIHLPVKRRRGICLATAKCSLPTLRWRKRKNTTREMARAKATHPNPGETVQLLNCGWLCFPQFNYSV
jgi:hypothetical protein